MADEEAIITFDEGTHFLSGKIEDKERIENNENNNSSNNTKEMKHKTGNIACEFSVPVERNMERFYIDEEELKLARDGRRVVLNLPSDMIENIARCTVMYRCIRVKFQWVENTPESKVQKGFGHVWEQKGSHHLRKVVWDH